MGFVVALLAVNPAAATLGQAPAVPGAPAPSAAPAAKSLSTAPAAQAALYRMQATPLENGTTVREYVSSSGVVFAVAWRGPVLPDLSALLGSYFKSFKAETEQARALGKRGSPVNLANEKLVVRSTGRMRDFSGHAYAPELIPAGVDIHAVLP
ncbi:MAG: DUF2844 domain-containing protein [Rhodoferax sp.]